MNLKTLNDHQLLANTKSLVSKERHILTQVLRHLREIERRRLYSDLGYRSLFEYAVKELKYSEGQAGRRIQAMRLIKEIPAIEKKVESGSISLSNLSQAQSFFRESKKDADTPVLKPMEKLQIIEKLENQSAREGQKVLIRLQPKLALPKEKVRAVTPEHSEVRFVMDEALKRQLDEVRSLFGIKGSQMNLSELIGAMAKLTALELKARKFGRRRVYDRKVDQPVAENLGEINIIGESELLCNGTSTVEKQRVTVPERSKASESTESINKKINPSEDKNIVCCGSAVRAFNKKRLETVVGNLKASQNNKLQAPTLEQNGSTAPNNNNRRAISKAIQKRVWDRDDSACLKCDGTVNLNVDHIKPVAKGGGNDLDNLRLLCFSCNQREGIRQFGLEKLKRE